ncbi:MULTISPECIES: RHS repeat domain-containing protein [Pseudomonadota]|jgi:hypothetical protein|uniref:RHS repeat domain-containing protein n=1 Tax=Pseudomonadota TaxID=1224 RepID=UPI000AF33A33|nr:MULTISPECIES: RHS repeat domain-containing protein [Pseudomonadota]
MRYLKQLILPISFIAVGVAVLSASASSSAPMNETVNYSYDDLGRLVKVEQKGDASSNATSNYAYDKAGNRTNVNVTRTP